MNSRGHYGGVVKLVITSACHAEGRGFESLRSRHFLFQKIEDRLSGLFFCLFFRKHYFSSKLDSLHFVVDCTALNPLTTGIEQSQTIITKVSISESPFLDELCDVVKAFGSGICNPIFKIIQDLLTPSLKCSS